MADTRRLTIRPLERDDWPLVEQLFGTRGACAGCWCMEMRNPRGTRLEDVQGEPNRAALRALVQADRVHALLALDADGEPRGWCSLGPRADFPKLLGSRVMRSDAGDTPWAVVCFFIPATERGAGLGQRLLKAAVELARARGAPALEGYPVNTAGRDGKPYPASFAFVGVPQLFERAGFRDVTPDGQARPVYRRTFRRTRGR